jgi:hypothetical protein
MLTVGGGNGRTANGSLYELQSGSPEHQVELFDPASGRWVLGPAQQIDRAYHSTALLLPDGRVFSAGDNNAYVYGKPYEGSDHNSAEIYSPPYLFRGTRPSITSAPSASLYNTPFHVSLADVDPAQAHAVLIPPAAVTHSTNPNPRIVPLSSTPTAGGLDLLAPANANIAPRGWYMLFVVNSNGVPSVATWLHVGYPEPPAAAPQGNTVPGVSRDTTAPSTKLGRLRLGRNGVATITLGCPASETRCKWAYSLSSSRRIRLAKGKKGRILKLGSGHASAAGGHSVTVRIRLTKTTLALVRRKRKLAVTLTLREVDAAGNKASLTKHATLRAPASKHT